MNEIEDKIKCPNCGNEDLDLSDKASLDSIFCEECETKIACIMALKDDETSKDLQYTYIYLTPAEALYTSTGRLRGYESFLILSHPFTRNRLFVKEEINHLMEGEFESKYREVFPKLEKKQKQYLNQKLADLKNDKAIKQIESAKKILQTTLDIDDTIDWSKYTQNDLFIKKQIKHEFIDFDKNGKPIYFDELFIPSKPIKEDFLDISSLWHFIKLYNWRLKKQTEKYNAHLKEWNKDKAAKMKENKFREDMLNKEIETFEKEEKIYLDKQKENNNRIKKLQEEYEKGKSKAIIEYSKMVLKASIYPEFIKRSYDLDYNSKNKMLFVDFSLPKLDDIPNLEKVNYVKAQDKITEKLMSKSILNKLYDDVLYQITLRTIHELFEADYINAIDSINFNGFVTDIDKSIGKNKTLCLVSLQTSKDEFEEINLNHVEPKTCFKSLKGICAAKLHTLTPIKPIISMNKKDKRFIDSYEVVGKMDDSINLAAMGWEDFEHFVRELFEKEFAADGGEVKVTQSSSDGGVDAIAFDPDPIRGGKIVIQAKRYTNVVGVAAVRDLYGTVMNEGANKGILVTTADFGSDSHKFAKDKPITLINGNELLYLLEKHGKKAKIDLKEAKRILKEEDRR